MSGEAKGPGAVALGWWRRNLEPRDNPAARALAARLRSAAPMAVLCEPAVHELATALALRPPEAEQLVRLSVLLAELRDHDPVPLAKRLGGAEPVLSPLRFQRLMRAEGEEVTDLLRRAIVMAERRCNVAALAADLLHWQAARPGWCFQYFGAEAPAGDMEEKTG